MKRSLLLVALSIVTQMAFCQPDKTAYYKADSYTYEGITLPFRQLDMNQDKDGKSILVVQLHGGTARGTNNTSQLSASAVDSVEIYLRVHGTKAIFLLPQCASDRQWNESTRSVTTPMTEVLSHWLQDFIASNDIDSTRVYITGYSMGGSGTWRMLNDNTTMFAAACIAAANPLMVEAAKVKLTPVYAIAGENDNIMDAEKIEQFATSLQTLGGEARYDMLTGCDHFATCDGAFTRERLAWMFSHKRNTPTAIHLNENNVNTVPEQFYTINGTPTNASAMGILIVKQANGTVHKIIKR